MKIATSKITVVLIIVMLLTLQCITVGCSAFLGPNENDIEILDSQLKYVNRFSGLSLMLKIKNNYSGTIKTSFKVSIYADGAVFDSTFSDVITLGAGEVGYLSSISYTTGNLSTKYTYKITGWNFYNV